MSSGGGTKAERTKSSSVLRILLILSAIDLLCSALTAGLVLFVILVGGNAGSVEAAASPGAAGSGLNEILAVDSSGKVQLFGPPEITKQARGNATPAPADSIENMFFKTPTVFRRIYLVPSRYSRISVIGTSTFELIVRPISGLPVHLFVQCADDGKALEFSLSPLSFPDCAVKVAANSVTLQKPSKILVSSKNNSLNLSEQSSPSTFVRKYSIAGMFAMPTNLAIWGLEE
ncbi:hypothetical protein [Bradyrhizobium sp. USDA 4469]